MFCGGKHEIVSRYKKGDKMNKKIVYSIMLATQLIIPGSMIFQNEAVLRTGNPYKFKTAPVDPYDAMRGKYVALSVVAADVTYDGKRDIKPGQIVYPILEQDADGFARFKAVAFTRPLIGDYIEAKAGWISNGKLRLQLPFDRYYMNEYKAQQAQDLYRKYSTKNNQDAYVVVMVSKGRAVIKDLYVAGKPIAELAKSDEN
jgi:uncharacterized membrane-anchored protein